MRCLLCCCGSEPSEAAGAADVLAAEVEELETVRCEPETNDNALELTQPVLEEVFERSKASRDSSSESSDEEDAQFGTNQLNEIELTNNSAAKIRNVSMRNPKQQRARPKDLEDNEKLLLEEYILLSINMLRLTAAEIKDPIVSRKLFSDLACQFWRKIDFQLRWNRTAVPLSKAIVNATIACIDGSDECSYTVTPFCCLIYSIPKTEVESLLDVASMAVDFWAPIKDPQPSEVLSNRVESVSKQKQKRRPRKTGAQSALEIPSRGGFYNQLVFDSCTEIGIFVELSDTGVINLVVLFNAIENQSDGAWAIEKKYRLDAAYSRCIELYERTRRLETAANSCVRLAEAISDSGKNFQLDSIKQAIEELLNSLRLVVEDNKQPGSKQKDGVMFEQIKALATQSEKECVGVALDHLEFIDDLKKICDCVQLTTQLNDEKVNELSNSLDVNNLSDEPAMLSTLRQLPVLLRANSVSMEEKWKKCYTVLKHLCFFSQDYIYYCGDMHNELHHVMRNIEAMHKYNIR